MFELRDTIRRLDAETDYKYDLVGMYEATELSEPEKKLIATMRADAKDPEEIAGELFKIFNTQNAMNMDEDCDNTLTEDVEEIQDGDEIVYNGEHLFVTNSDYMDLGRWLWVTDKEEDRYNKEAAGWSLAKELVDEVIGQPDEEELDEALNENIKTLDDFLQDAEVILVDDAETFDINEWEGKNAAEMSEELEDNVNVKSESKFIKYKLEDADVDKVVEKIKNSSINIVDYWKTKQFLKKRGLDKGDLDEVIHNLSKEDYKTNYKSVDDVYNEAIIFIKDSKIKDLGPFNMYIKLDYDSVEENPVIVISIHETSRKQSNNELEEDTIKQNGKWVNKGKEGTHGEFATKKEADAQRKAMFANGYKEELNEDVNMTRKEMIDWIEDNWNNNPDNADWLYDYLTELGFNIDDDSDEEEGLYANLTDDNLRMIIDELKPNTKPRTKEQLTRIKNNLKSLGRIDDVDIDFGSDEATFDLSTTDGDTFRIQIYKI